MGNVTVPDAVHYGLGSDCSAYTAPRELIELVGLNNHVGAFYPGLFSDEARFFAEYDVGGVMVESLAGLNDSTDTTPQQIGMWLEDCIEGGPGTPFIPLSRYHPEAAT